MKKDVTQDELDAYWVRELGKVAAPGRCKSVCYCVDVRSRAENESLVPALFVRIVHPDYGAEIIRYPYVKNQDASVVLGRPAIEHTNYQIFAPSDANP